VGVEEDDPCPVEQAVSSIRIRRPQTDHGGRDHCLGDVILDKVIANSFLDVYVYLSSVNARQGNFSFHLIISCLPEIDLKITGWVKQLAVPSHLACVPGSQAHRLHRVGVVRKYRVII